MLQFGQLDLGSITVLLCVLTGTSSRKKNRRSSRRQR